MIGLLLSDLYDQTCGIRPNMSSDLCYQTCVIGFVLLDLYDPTSVIRLVLSDWCYQTCVIGFVLSDLCYRLCYRICMIRLV